MNLSAAEMVLYEKIKGITPTKFLNRATLQKLQMLECMEKCLQHAGLGRFMDLRVVSYPELTMQFLATHKVELHDGGITGVTFRFEGTEYSLPVERIRTAFGVTRHPTHGWIAASPDQLLMDFFQAISGETYQISNEYSSRVTHPVLRLLCKIISGTIYGLSTDTKLSMSHLRYVYSAVPTATYTPDWVRLFFEGLERVTKDRSAGGPEMAQGGLITLLAIAAGVPEVDQLEGGVAPKTYTEEFMRKCLMLDSASDGGQVWCVGNKKEHQFRLPKALPWSENWKDWFIKADYIPPPTTKRSRGRRLEVGGSSGTAGFTMEDQQAEEQAYDQQAEEQNFQQGVPQADYDPCRGWESYQHYESPQYSSHQWAPWPPQAYQDAYQQPHHQAYMDDQIGLLRQEMGNLTTIVQSQGRRQDQLFQQQADILDEVRGLSQAFYRQFPPPDQPPQ